jgi:two-component system chemotaxis response regulator CheY
MATPILVVDDSAVSRSIVIRSLPPGWDVAISQASNGSEALAVLATKPQAVVLLDLNMPVMDGYQFLEALHAGANADRALPVVIVLSGDVQPEARARVTKLGARAFVNKPIKRETVLAALKESGVL